MGVISMTLGEKLKEIRKRFGLSQEQLAKLLNVSRQAITKWENDGGIPDITNLQELSKVFSITVDYLLDEDHQLPALSMRKVLDKDQYGYFDESYEIYTLVRRRKMQKLEWILDFLTWGIHENMDMISDLSPYYLVKKDGLKFLVNIKDWVLEVIALPEHTNDKKFSYKQNTFIKSGQLK